MPAAAQAAAAPSKTSAPAREPAGKGSADKKKPSPAANPLWQALAMRGGMVGGLLGGITGAPAVQRKCRACDDEASRPPVQTALTIGPVDDPFEREADAVADRVMRKARGGSDAWAPASVSRSQAAVTPIRRVCKRCGEEEVQRKPCSSFIQRRCSKCDEEFESVQRSGMGSAAPTDRVASLVAAPGTGAPLPQSVRDPSESVLNADLSGVRVHSDARANDAAADINARAFTYGNNIYLGAGESSHDIGLMAHELTHTVQQGASPMRTGSALQRSPDRIQRFDLPSMEDVTGAIDSVGDAVSEAADSAIETGTEIVEGAGEAVGEAVDTIGGIAADVWDAATALGEALGGVVSFSGGRLTINVPPFSPCPEFAFQFAVPTPPIPLAVVAGVLPLHPLLGIYGALYAAVTVTPEVSAQLGPCQVHGLHIVIDPLGDNYTIAGWMTMTSAFGFGEEVALGIGGHVGAYAILPTEPPIPLAFPVNLEGGLAFQYRAIAAATSDLMIYANYSGGTFTEMLHGEDTVGIGFDWGLGAYAQLDVMTINLCRAYFPLKEGHWDTAIHYELDALVNIGANGFTAALSLGGFDSVPFDTIPLALNREVLTDDCMLTEQLCPILYALGYMPSQNGGKWEGHPEPAWQGPLEDVFPRSPDIESRSKCRGACGPECKTCSKPTNKAVCVPRETPEGKPAHDWLIYPNYQKCPTHQGCRDHDACYDWCAEGGGPHGLEPFLCRRLCDFECACNYRPLACAAWIFGGEPHDKEMFFSERPYTKPGCEIPCPEPADGGEDGGDSGGGDSGDSDSGGSGGSGGNTFTVCMPTLDLFDEISDGRDFNWGPEELPIWNETIVVPYVGPVSFEIIAGAEASARGDASLGPGRMQNVCFDINPLAHKYVARGEISIPARLSGTLSVRATLTGDVSWFFVIELASATGSLTGTATADIEAEINPSWRATVDAGCGDGQPGSLLKPTLETDLKFNPCLSLGFLLQAGISIDALTFNVWQHSWDLASAHWTGCMGEDLDVDAEAGRDPDLDMRDIHLSLPDILEWLLSGGAEEEDQDDTPSAGRTVVEDPLTNEKARTIPSLVPVLDNTTYTSETFSLLPLPSGRVPSATVGRSMMTRYLTRGKTGGGEPSGQTGLYRRGKLPTLGAFGGGSGIGDMIYIRGHLLNHSAGTRTLHGVGEPRNLFPITHNANDRHNDQIEEPIKDLVVDDGLVVMYGVDVTNDAPQYVDVARPDANCQYQYVNSTFRCTYATYKLYSDNTVELNEPQGGNVPSVFDVSTFQARCPCRE